MHNSPLKFVVLAISLLVLTGCNLPFVGKTVQERAGDAINGALNDEKDTGRSTKDEQTVSEASDSEVNFNSCMQGCAMLNGAGMFSKEFCTDSCWAGAAKDTKDISICDTKVDSKNDIVQAACRINVAEETMDPKNCDGIGAADEDMFRISCYSSVAKKRKDPAVCDLIKTEMFKTICQEDAKSAE